MLDLSEAHDFLRNLAAARMRGDVDAIMGHLHDDPVLQVVGVGTSVEGHNAVRATVAELVQQFEFLEWRPLDTVVQGETIAVRQHLKVRHRQSGRVAATETAEFLTIKDGRCVAYTQYTDTALIAELGRAL